jgi:predicted Zn-dependent protease
VQPRARFEAFSEDYVPAVRRAFTDWTDVGIPMAFTFVMDSGAADIRVTWIDRFREPISGKTIWAHDEGRWIIDASIQLAVRHQSGEPLDSTAVSAIALHEVGHLLGLDHTTDTSSIMAPKVRVSRLSPADRATVQLLYRLPAGKLN